MFVNVSANFSLLYSMKKGRVVILLAGRRAGKKAIIVKPLDEGKKVSSHNSSSFVFRTASSPMLLLLALRKLPARSFVA